MIINDKLRDITFIQKELEGALVKIHDVDREYFNLPFVKRMRIEIYNKAELNLIERLPVDLTYLELKFSSIGLKKYNITELLSNLPPRLEELHLEVSGCYFSISIDDFTEFPDSIKYLIVNNQLNIRMISRLPRCLEYLIFIIGAIFSYSEPLDIELLLQ